jgi:lipid-A-disaccharide synthase
VGIVAGEASGDLLGSQLIHALRAIHPGLRFRGIGGPRMGAAGMDILFPMEKLAVRGYAEVVRHLWEILGIRRKVARHFINEPPDFFIGIDAPDFNLTLEARLKSRGIPTVHYVSPAIWMWRRERMKKIKRAVDKMLTLFPFETRLYEEAGVDVEFVGHPLADMLDEIPGRDGAREQLKLHAAGPVFAMLPGSRQSELQQMGRLFIETAKELHARNPEAQFLVPLQSRETRLMFENELYRANATELPIHVLFGHAHMAMAASDIVLVASGTATLEAALLGKPMVITYRMAASSYWLLSHKEGYLPYYGLPNILSGGYVVPEILQYDATPKNLARALINLLEDETARGRLGRCFAALNDSLRRGAAAHAARALEPLLASKRKAA